MRFQLYYQLLTYSTLVPLHSRCMFANLRTWDDINAVTSLRHTVLFMFATTSLRL
jgi:hypothetical protein